MSRSDSVLNTGMSSAIDRKLAEKARERAKSKLSTQARLRPDAEIIMAAIAKEKQKVATNLATLPITFETSEESVKAYLLAQKMHLDFLSTFQNTMLNMLRVKEPESE